MLVVFEREVFVAEGEQVFDIRIKANGRQLVGRTRELFVGLFDTEDQAEGVNAFLEKRKANWKNR